MAKAVLLALADDCAHDGTGAWPAVATIAAETEVGKRTVDVVLRELQAFELIAQEAPAKRHKPVTWRLNLARLVELSGSQQCATLNDSGSQNAATLAGTADTHHVATPSVAVASVDPQVRSLDPQFPIADPQHVAHDPVLSNGPLNSTAASPQPPSHPERRTSGYALHRAALTREPAPDGNFFVIVRLAHTVFDDTGRSSPDDPDLVELVKQGCARAHIAYGPPAAAPDIVARAVAYAYAQRLVGRRTPAPENGSNAD